MVSQTTSEAAEQDTEPAPPASKRRRVGLACNACRVRKSRYAPVRTMLSPLTR
jgi:hypothetical protein